MVSIMKKNKHILKIVFICIIANALFFGMIYYFINKNQTFSYISFINSIAENHYNSFNNGLIDYNNIFSIYKNKEYIIYGECHDYDYYIAYANELIKKDTLIYGSNDKKANNYWAIKIQNKIIVEVWVSNYPLKKEQLHPYTIEEQYKQIHLFEKFSSSKAIGYYNAKNK